MMEVVFSGSACGSLKIARSCGKGTCLSAFSRREGDAAPAVEQEGEHAAPLGDQIGDVYCFDLALSVGDLSEDGLGERRKAVLRAMLSLRPFEDAERQTEENLLRAGAALSSLLERYRRGEELRLWYSHTPDEECGMDWLMAQLQPLKGQAAVRLVCLPHWEYGKENTVIERGTWGEVAPGEWGAYLSRQETARPDLVSACAMEWRRLREENAPLRAVLNGRLQSVPEELYDGFLLRELAAQPEEFKMAVVIGNVLGKYRLGISDTWLALRMEKMLREGLLEVVRAAPEGDRSYSRTLRKRGK